MNRIIILSIAIAIVAIIISVKKTNYSNKNPPSATSPALVHAEPMVSILPNDDINIYGSRNHSVAEYLDSGSKKQSLAEYLDHLEDLKPENDLLGKFFSAQIAYNVPEKINIQDSRIIELKLSTSKSIEDLKREITKNNGKTNGAKIEISDYVTAELIGSQFRIDSLTDKSQYILKNKDTQWKWEVFPTVKGLHSIHLKLTASIKINGDNKTKTIESYNRKILVEVTPIQTAKAFITTNWQWLGATLLIPLFGVIWKRFKETR